MFWELLIKNIYVFLFIVIIYQKIIFIVIIYQKIIFIVIIYQKIIFRSKIL
jgi:hypothetical protein